MSAYLFDDKNLPTYDELRASGTEPSVHGNGFIQLDLCSARNWRRNEPIRTTFDEYRLHVWHHEVPRQAVPSMIHDHRFGFTSTVHYGRIANLVYDVVPPNEDNHHQTRAWQAWQAVPQSHVRNTILERARNPSFDLELKYAEVVGTGHETQYQMMPFVFHETVPLEPSVTVIEKWYPRAAEDHVLARVCLPRGVEPDNEFRREDQSQELAWAIIEEMLSKCQSH